MQFHPVQSNIPSMRFGKIYRFEAPTEGIDVLQKKSLIVMFTK